MQKQATISVKEAASLLELDERTIRERLINGSLRGEKRNIGQRDKWFVYAAAIEAEVRQKRSAQNTAEMLNNIGPPPADPMNFNAQQGAPAAEYQHGKLEGLQQRQRAIYPTAHGQQNEAAVSFTQANVKMEAGLPGGFNAHLHMPASGPMGNGASVEADPLASDIVDAEFSGEFGGDTRSWLDKEREAIRALAEEMVRPIAEQLQRKDKELQDASYRIGYIEGLMKDQEEQIKLLPDYQARAEEAARLKDQVAAEKLETKIANEKVAAEKKQAALKALEIESLKKQIAVLEDEQKQALENERHLAEESLKRADDLSREMEILKAEKEAQASAIQNQLTSLSTKLEKMERPWWKKLFSASE